MTQNGSWLDGPVPGLLLLVGGGLSVVALATGAELWWLGFLLTGVAVRLSVGLAARRDSGTDAALAGATGEESDPAVRRLRERYVRGGLTETAFERRLDRVLADERESDPDPERGDERERRADAETEPVAEVD
ncbi:hypothetical protein BRD13_01665 [Halobacteriales archaeon SW_5_70_135]|nr:MAG: hypothetical protein BRD13_01665 [Halobacteriales archaeon SW_5_70_135]